MDVKSLIISLSHTRSYLIQLQRINNIIIQNENLLLMIISPLGGFIIPIYTQPYILKPSLILISQSFLHQKDKSLYVSVFLS